MKESPRKLNPESCPDSDVTRVESICLRLLTRREHSRTELQRKLAARGFTGGCVDQVLEKLSHQGLQQDRRFAEEYARIRIGRGFGPVRIRQELGVRGVSATDVEHCLSAWEGRWETVLSRVYEKKFGVPDPESGQDPVVCFRFLMQRGFYPAQINALFREQGLNSDRC